MAIFSQEIEQTKVDFRKYSKEIPNRYVPYDLPKTISMKLKRLMDNLKLNSGSIDLVYTKDEDYYFLEVNPVGQFAMVSEPCKLLFRKNCCSKLSENENKYMKFPKVVKHLLPVSYMFTEKENFT